MMEKDGDPNAGLFGRDEPEISEEEFASKQIYEKNPKRASALADLCYADLESALGGMDLDEEAKRRMLFAMTVNGVLDLIADSLDAETAMEVSYCLDMYMGVSLANKRFSVDLFKEHGKALAGIRPSDFDDEEVYLKTLAEAEERWWEMPQPRLDKRTPNEAIRETLSRYGLTE
ncbi:MAG: hypothetical protein LBG62_01795 [Candidatus Methanoplasma sp.]|nr:hypothetical protein [Candidatus Methanoplasma sp.]